MKRTSGTWPGDFFSRGGEDMGLLPPSVGFPLSVRLGTLLAVGPGG